MAASLCFKSCEDHRLLKGYNGGLWNTVTGLGQTDRDVVIYVAGLTVCYKNR